MLLSISELEIRRKTFAETWEPGGFDFADSGVTQTGKMTAEGVAELVPHSEAEVRVKGRVVTEVETECDRCLGRAKFPVDAPFDLYYKPIAAVNEAAGGEDEEIELDEGEAEVGFYELPGLELEDILREQVLLQLPIKRVCSETCLGICSVCGSNRNETACECVAAAAKTALPGEDDRWKALKDIHLKEVK